MVQKGSIRLGSESVIGQHQVGQASGASSLQSRHELPALTLPAAGRQTWAWATPSLAGNPPNGMSSC